MDKYKKIVGESKLKELLNTAYSRIEQPSIEVVMGNPSCDQDSFIGSHILAAVMGRVPVVNLCREIFECKHDLVKVCDIMGVSMDELVFLAKQGSAWFLQRGSKKYALAEKKITALLIDFNLPDKDLLLSEGFSIDRIIDHHPILEFSQKVHSKAAGMDIELCAGSCCSLIYRFVCSQFAKTLEEKKATKEYNFLLLLSIPIMTDTSGLESRVHDVDVNGVRSSLGAAGASMQDAQEVLASLSKLKKCEDKIKTELILQMDYKPFDYPANHPGKSFGISSVKYAYDDWVQRDGKEEWKRKVKEFVQGKGHEFFIINCKVKGVRELYVYNAPGSGLIEKGIYEGKPVSKRSVAGDSEIVVYNVSPTISRKIVAPMIYKYLSEQNN
ncbi:exopolyphosphatase [Nematocida major]|uniref:exopolyphosphatase n=1 Tax=Nematocida major TaxID=1912982 RepID=UPI0020085B5B|nr:exopolyphosphatase [Nematocida major]KAH9386225.1 exopolyphosphatase [Nematocida major]